MEDWVEGPRAPGLGPGEVHVWRAALDVAAGLAASLEATLAVDERQRADRLRRPEHRARFVAARGLLRTVLARYVGGPASAIAFRYGDHGKPELPCGSIRFNLSHSEGLAVLAVASDGPLGVDIERVRPMDDVGRMVERFFADGERAAFARLDPGEALEAFFRAWTRKEAYLKAIGTGLARPLSSVEVTLAPGEPPGLLDAVGGPAELAGWSLLDLRPGPGFLGALAVAGPVGRLLRFEAPWDTSESPP